VPGTRPQIAENYKIMSPVAIPKLGLDPAGKASMHLVWSGTWGDNPPPEPFPMDSMRVDVLRGQESEDIAHKAVVQLLSIL